MKTLIAFNTVEEIYQILGWKYTGNWKEDEPLRDKLWDNGFNLDDWDGGFACKEPFKTKFQEDGEEWFEWDNDVEWLGYRMANYCVGYHHVEYGGWHWYTVHHS
jgi:hypothetical protein